MKKLLLIFILLPILGFAQGFQTKTDTIHFLNQNKVIALGDTLNKKLDDIDTTSTVANQWRVNLKQNTISNIADTSKYIEYSDTGTTANKIIKLDGAAKLPAVDGSQLTGISAGATILMAVKTADETVNNSITYQNDDHLFISLEANSIYQLELFMMISQGGITAAIKADFTVPTGTTIEQTITRNENNNSTFYWTHSEDLRIEWQNGCRLLGADNVIISRGAVFTLGTAGNLVLRWAQNTADLTDTKVTKGSYLKLTKVQ